MAKTFPGTPAAAKASAAVAAYEKDPAFKRKVLEAEAGTKARAALSMAKSYKSAGKTDLARRKLQAIIDEFPGTSFAETARKELEVLKG